MSIVLNGTTGITTPDLDTDGLTSNGIDDNATSTAMTLDASGNVGIGTSSPSSLIHASGAAASGGAVEIRLEDTAASSNSRLMRTGSAYSYAGVGANETWLYHSGAGTINIGPDGAGAVKIVNNGAERIRIDSAGHAIIPAGVTLGTAAGVYAAANTLDDYEEGIFTPTSLGGITSPTLTNTSGHYTKVGRLVTFTVRWEVSVGTGNGNHFRIGGLPFTSSSATGTEGGATLNYQGGFKSDRDLSLHVTSNSTEIHFYQPSDGSILTGAEASNINAAMHINGFYYSTS